MFTMIDGGFQVTVNELVTMNLSWLFMFCSVVSANCIFFVIKIINKLKKWAK